MSKNNYGVKIRQRVCGIYVKDEKILLLNHPEINDGKNLWLPPGGRAEYGADLKTNLKREFLEETNLEVQVGGFMFLHEYVNKPLHAIESFFQIDFAKGKVKLGYDPELPPNRQIITDWAFLSFPKINALPEKEKHNIFNFCDSIESLLSLSGYFKNSNNYLK